MSPMPAKAFTSGSDITLADYWGIEHFYPDMDDNHGTSLVIVKQKKEKKQLMLSLINSEVE